MLENDVAQRRFEAAYLQQGDLIGAVTVNRVGRLTFCQQRIRAKAALRIEMWNRLEAACLDLPHGPASEMFERFLHWTG